MNYIESFLGLGLILSLQTAIVGCKSDSGDQAPVEKAPQSTLGKYVTEPKEKARNVAQAVEEKQRLTEEQLYETGGEESED